MAEVLKGIGKVQIWQQIIGGIIFSCILFCVASIFIRKKVVREKVLPGL